MRAGAAEQEGTLGSGRGIQRITAGLDVPVTQIGQLLSDEEAFGRWQGGQIVHEIPGVALGLGQRGGNIVAVEVEAAADAGAVEEVFVRVGGVVMV